MMMLDITRLLAYLCFKNNKNKNKIEKLFDDFPYTKTEKHNNDDDKDSDTNDENNKNNENTDNNDNGSYAAMRDIRNGLDTALESGDVFDAAQSAYQVDMLDICFNVHTMMCLLYFNL